MKLNLRNLFRLARRDCCAPWLAAFIILLAFAAFAQPESPPATLPELQQRLAERLAQPRFAAALWGVKIVSLDTGNVLFEQNADKLLSPASNAKLYTVALALDRLGPEYRIRTSLYARTRPDPAGALAGDLVLYGRGDPTINARLHGGDLFQALSPLLAALTNAGVKRVAGDLVGDASFFRGPELGAGWDWEDQEHAYGAELSALTIGDNVVAVTLRPGERTNAPGRLSLSPPTACLVFSNRTETVAQTGRRNVSFFRVPGENLVYVSGQVPLGDAGYSEDVPLHHPAGLFIERFRAALARQGIQVAGRLRALDWLDRQVEPLDPAGLVELGALESPPLREVAPLVLKPSQNLYAELLLAHVGEKRRAADTPPGLTSEQLGIRELNRFLAQAGIKAGAVHFEEGSGLSRNNLTTASATVALLRYMSRHPCADLYLQSLPVAGVDGTLRNRMQDTPAAGNVRAKTGSLRWANSLSGYVTTAAGERLAFSLMLNRYSTTDPSHSARAELDAIAVMLAGLGTGRTEENPKSEGSPKSEPR